MRSIFTIAVAGVVLVSAAPAGAYNSKCFRFSGGVATTLPTFGGLNCQTAAINDSGQIAGQADLPPGQGTHAFLATGITMTDLGTLGGDFSSAAALNNAGTVAGRSTTSGNTTHAFLYAAGTMTDLGTLGGDPNSFAVAVNDAGQVVGQSGSLNGSVRAFLYDGGTMTDLGSLGGSTTVLDINDAGQVVGSSHTGSNKRHAFLYDSGVMTDLGTLGGDESEAIAINEAGQIAGYAQLAGGVWHAFFYESGVMTDLGELEPGTSLHALAIGEDGKVVGHSDLANIPTAFVYDSGVLTGLGDGIARDINDAGDIVIEDYPGARIRSGVTDTEIPLPEFGASIQVSGIDSAGDVAGFFYGAFCPDQPLAGCREPGKASLRVRDGSPDATDQISWKWGRGDALDWAEIPYGDVLFCIYDSIAGTPTVATRLHVDGYPNFILKTPQGRFFYQHDGNDDGVFKASLKAGSDGRTAASLAARGVRVPVPTAASASTMFHQQGAVTAQLFTDAAFPCWTSSFSSALRNTPENFKARTP